MPHNTKSHVRAASIVAAVALTSLTGAGTPALAHRDGCHAAHSCPSDRGTYVCGDTGNFSQCGYSSLPEEDFGTSTSVAEPFVAADTTPPSEPLVADPVASGGGGRVQVTAERGSRLTVTEDAGREVLSTRATGERQSLSFRGADGTHTYSVQATDRAGNASSVSSFNLTLDGTAPPALKLSTQAPTGRGVLTAVRLVGVPGDRYTLRLARRGVGVVRALSRDGVLDSSGAAVVSLLIADGQYVASSSTMDAGGNTSPTTETPLAVALPAPTLDITRTSALNDSLLALSLAGPGRGTGVVVLEADGSEPVELPFTLDEAGTAVVSSSVADGTYVASGRVIDFQMRRVGARESNLLVDTVAPALAVTVDGQAADNQRVAAAVETEQGAQVVVLGLPGQDELTLRSGEDLRVAAEDGKYALTFLATDVAGNVTELRRTVSVSHPLTLAEGLLGFTFLSLPFVVGLVLWRRRDRIRDRMWARRARKEGARLQLEHQRQVASYEAAVAAHQGAVAAHQRDMSRWTEHRSDLQALEAEARLYDGYDLALPDGVRRKPGEVVYSNVDNGAMLEIRRPNGADVLTVVDRGSIFVTNERVLFDGDKRREWSFDKLEGVRHVNSDGTILQVSNRQKPSGIGYASSQQAKVRRHFDIALAVSQGDRQRLIDQGIGAVHNHESAVPVPPAPLTQVRPAPPYLPTADDLRRAAGKLPQQQSLTTLIPTQPTPAEAPKVAWDTPQQQP